MFIGRGRAIVAGSAGAGAVAGKRAGRLGRRGRMSRADAGQRGSRALITTLSMSAIHTVHKIHQILIIDGYALPERPPPLIQTNIESATGIYSQAIHKVWSGNGAAGIYTIPYGNRRPLGLRLFAAVFLQE